MNSKRNQIVISTASMAAALQALSGAAHDGAILRTANDTPYDAIAREAVAGSQVQAAIQGSIGDIVSTIRINPDVLQSDYGRVAVDVDTDWPLGIDPDLLSAVTGQNEDPGPEIKQQILSSLGLAIPPGESLDEYFETIRPTLEKAASDDLEGAILVASAPHLQDSTRQSGYFSCYRNCHSACHGSRGWR